MPDERPDDWFLVLRPESSDVPEEVRVRKALKAMLRRLGLRCVDFGKAWQRPRRTKRKRHYEKPRKKRSQQRQDHL